MAQKMKLCPYDGGIGILGHDSSQPKSAATWAAHNGCDESAVETEHNNGKVTRFEWPNCDDERAVVHYKLDAIGYSVPPDVEGDTLGLILILSWARADCPRSRVLGPTKPRSWSGLENRRAQPITLT